MHSYSIIRLLFVLLAAVCVFAELEEAGSEPEYFIPYLKKAGPSGPLRFGKRNGPSGPLRFGKRSLPDSSAYAPQQPYPYFPYLV
ncbi:unnamed protein product [Cylicocyclus nassatus]|uniref:Uncharacterized protein n=1 Tax=Cylicocyclus nassatus TaxID=53992 RepID=A0AA36GSR7_CYLNA|nr:unnamed protein product [Cylicocyclus nassatus]